MNLVCATTHSLVRPHKNEWTCFTQLATTTTLLQRATNAHILSCVIRRTTTLNTPFLWRHSTSTNAPTTPYAHLTVEEVGKSLIRTITWLPKWSPHSYWIVRTTVIRPMSVQHCDTCTMLMTTKLWRHDRINKTCSWPFRHAKRRWRHQWDGHIPKTIMHSCLSDCVQILLTRILLLSDERILYEDNADVHVQSTNRIYSFNY